MYENCESKPFLFFSLGKNMLFWYQTIIQFLYIIDFSCNIIIFLTIEFIIEDNRFFENLDLQHIYIFIILTR